MPTATKPPSRVALSDELRARVAALTVESDSDRRMVERYLTPGAKLCRSNIDWLESLAHPDRLGQEFRNHPPPHPSSEQ